jgi:hypothetical protein
MSDPTWGTRNLPKGAEGTLYVQAAGVTAAPGTANELAFVTEAGIEIAGEREKKGPWLNYSKQKTSPGGVGFTGSANIDWSKAVDDNRELVITSAIAADPLKFTLVLYENGDTFEMDYCYTDASIALSAAEGATGEFSWDADTCDYTAATA